MTRLEPPTPSASFKEDRSATAGAPRFLRLDPNPRPSRSRRGTATPSGLTSLGLSDTMSANNEEDNMKEMIEIRIDGGWRYILGNNRCRKLFSSDEADKTLADIRSKGGLARRVPVVPTHYKRGRIPELPQDPTPEMADKWIRDLIAAGFDYHYDDPPREVINAWGRRTFSDEEADYLQFYCMDQLFNSLEDPFENAIIASDPDYDPEA
jgi:hypothetical protein